MCGDCLCAVLVLLVVILLGAAAALAGVKLAKPAGLAGGAERAGYLVAPYLDLDEPGPRGSYYAMLEC